MPNSPRGSQSDDVQKIKDRLDILEVVGDKVRLHGSGQGYMGLCPFHDEKTPSFRVYPDRQNYHCFGCGKGGDIFTFVMETEGLDFLQALEVLAERAGIELTRPEGGKRRVSGSLHEVMEMAERFYRSLLAAPEGEAARAYLGRRGITARMASRFELGWSGSGWDSLWRALQSERVTTQEALDAGLVLEGQRGGFYDRFRGRVIFPIRDVMGRLIAFGGRIVDGEGAKYVNSPEGALYSKRRNLYLLHAAKNAVKEKKRAILVEGYMDVLRLHLHGYSEAVASLGTSLTEEQAKLLKRFSDRCYICYDSDMAGQEATLRGMYLLQNLGLDVHVISLPSGKDPDELLSSEGGKELFDEAIERARPLVLQHLHAVRSSLADPAARRKGVASLFEGLAQLQPTAVAPYIPQLAGALELYPNEFRQELEQFRRGRREREKNKEQRRAEEKKRAPAHDPLEAALCAMLWRDDDLRRSCRPEEILPLISDGSVKEIALAILMESPLELETRWHSMNERFPLAFIAQGGAFCEELEFSRTRDADSWDVVLDSLARKRAKERMDALDVRMKRNEATMEEMAEFQRLAAQLKGGKKRLRFSLPQAFPIPRT
ncbi:MAG: DNA primase [Synergistaceae bacterium]|jgi:DNA primase|nr:DNA primase [Synergistaceae bacterium]